MRKGLMAAMMFLGIMSTLTPVFGLQTTDKPTKQNTITIADEASAKEQYFVDRNGDCGGRTPCYDKIQDAVDAAPDGSDILVRQGAYEESINLTSAKTVLVKGGYDATYNGQTDNTTFIHGLGRTSVQATSGSLKFQMVSITPQARYTNSLGMTFVLLPAGIFTMGSPSDESGRSSNEGPQHQVTLTQSFYMQQTEVTQAQWEAVMGNNPSYFLGCATCPVERVSWFNVQDFIEAMNALGEGIYGLPTEAQWEYGARAGTTTAFYNGGITELGCSYDPNLNVIGWYCYNAENKSHPVAQKTPNAWGLYDMSGNVWEWCQDWFSSSYYSSSPTVDPTGPTSGTHRVIRGGGWEFYAQGCRSAFRYNYMPTTGAATVGFRLVLSSGQK